MMDFEASLRMARLFMSEANQSPEEAAENPIIPEKFRKEIESKLRGEETVEFSPAKIIAEADLEEWLQNEDREKWYYWKRLREYCISSKKWTIDRARSLDDSTDKILAKLSHPNTESFEKRGLVLGYVQSGKTANYTGLIAKAADVGYKFFIVLSGMDKGLRLQTQIRLQNELTGYHDKRREAVEYPTEREKRWSTPTTDEVDGDFDPGKFEVAAINPPILMVVKKNGPVLRRLLLWLTHSYVKSYPLLMIDDEADQASINTKGNEMEEDGEYSDPSAINGLVRELLSRFEKKSYVAYTATPFANILIPADAEHPEKGSDIYPKDFIIDLPKSEGYVGAEDLFGQSAFMGEESEDGMDIIRFIPENKEDFISAEITQALRDALMDFVLAGAARVKRDGEQPATMLVHVSRLIDDQRRLAEVVKKEFATIKDSWRYQRDNGIKEKFRQRWDDFSRVTKELDPTRPLIEFNELAEKFIGPFLESTSVREINSESGDILDYSSEPLLKTIVVGGDKLSRGLTLEGLLVSYFLRSTSMYDTLMQMGRWFGYRKGYADLTRIYTTPNIASQFAHLARVERQLREDLTIYENRGVKPEEIGMRILSHPSMLVTSPLKQRYAKELNISYSRVLFQTYRFPLNELEEIASSSDSNLQLVRNLLSDTKGKSDRCGLPFWENMDVGKVLTFLANFRNKEHENEIKSMRRYIEGRLQDEELIRWNVAVMMSLKTIDKLGVADWGIKVNQISRSRLYKKVNDLKSITGSRDELKFLSQSEKKDAENLRKYQPEQPLRLSSRCVRSPKQGLIMLYPISKYSSPRPGSENRSRLFEDPEHPSARDLIGLAISFPQSETARSEQYLHTLRPGWRE